MGKKHKKLPQVDIQEKNPLPSGSNFLGHWATNEPYPLTQKVIDPGSYGGYNEGFITDLRKKPTPKE